MGNMDTDPKELKEFKSLISLDLSRTVGLKTPQSLYLGKTLVTAAVLKELAGRVGITRRNLAVRLLGCRLEV